MFSFLILAALAAGANQPVGHLVIVGGGPTPPEVIRRALQLAGGKDARVLIIPQAAGWRSNGARSRRMWEQVGARRVTVLNIEDRKAALAAIRSADLIWMSGGSQILLMRALKEAKLTDAIRERFRQGATVGGTSAGAAVMSEIMISTIRLSGGGRRNLEGSGLGLWPEVIVDQHFLRRRRDQRLLDAVLHHPDKPGVGIDESTAVIVWGRRFEVLGKSKVVVLDARRRRSGGRPKGSPAADKVERHILSPGMSFDLDRGLLTGKGL